MPTNNAAPKQVSQTAQDLAIRCAEKFVLNRHNTPIEDICEMIEQLIATALHQAEICGAERMSAALRVKLLERMGNEAYGHAKASVALDIEELDALRPTAVVGE